MPRKQKIRYVLLNNQEPIMNALPDQTASAPKSKMLPPAYLALAILLMFALHRWLPGSHLFGQNWRWVGATAVVVGLAVNVGCALQFRRRQTTIIPFRESSELLTGGLYRFSRNPIYLSMFVLLGGVAAALGTLTPWLLLPVFVWIIATRFVRREEKMLIAAFGEAYDQYRQRVRRWL